MDTNTLLVGSLVAIVLGIVACFFGYRIFRILFAVMGFVAGAALGLLLASSLTLVPGQETIIRIILGLVGGLIGAVLAWLLYIVAVFLSGAGIGALIGAAIALALHADTTVQVILIVVLAIIAGIVAIALQKLFIILATAFGGAQLIVSGVSQLLNAGTSTVVFNPLALLQPSTEQAIPTVYFVMLVCWLVLGILGVLVQYRVTGRGVKHNVKLTTEQAREIQAGKDQSLP